MSPSKSVVVFANGKSVDLFLRMDFGFGQIEYKRIPHRIHRVNLWQYPKWKTVFRWIIFVIIKMLAPNHMLSRF